MAKRSQGLFPVNSSTDDDSGLLTTTYSLPVGVASAKTFQFNIVANFAADTDEVIIQIQKGDATKNLRYTFQDSQPGANPFVAGEYRIQAFHRGFGIEGLRVGLSSTATDIRVDCSATC